MRALFPGSCPLLTLRTIPAGRTQARAPVNPATRATGKGEGAVLDGEIALMGISDFDGSDHGRHQSPEEELPRLFIWFASLSSVSVVLSIFVSVYLSPADDPTSQFPEEGTNMALSAICMAMAGVSAALVFYLRGQNFRLSSAVLAAAGPGLHFPVDRRAAGFS